MTSKPLPQVRLLWKRWFTLRATTQSNIQRYQYFQAYLHYWCSIVLVRVFNILFKICVCVYLVGFGELLSVRRPRSSRCEDVHCSNWSSLWSVVRWRRSWVYFDIWITSDVLSVLTFAFSIEHFRGRAFHLVRHVFSHGSSVRRSFRQQHSTLQQNLEGNEGYHSRLSQGLLVFYLWCLYSLNADYFSF